MSPIPSIFPQTRPKAVLFDWDNTLADTTSVCYGAFNRALTSFDLPPLTLEEFYKRPHRSVRETFPDLFKDNAAEAEKIFYDYSAENYLEALRPFPGAERLCHWLAQKGIYSAVVSNKSGPYLRKELYHLRWEKYFKAIVGSGDTPEDKPSPLPLLKALEQGSAQGHEVWFVGDSSVDVLCAQKAGCIPVTVGPYAAHPEDPNVIHGKDLLGIANILAKL